MPINTLYPLLYSDFPNTEYIGSDQYSKNNKSAPFFAPGNVAPMPCLRVFLLPFHFVSFHHKNEK